MKLKKTVYDTIELAEDEHGMVVGNIVMEGDKMIYAEVLSGTIVDHKELADVQAFLHEVEKVMAK